MHSRTAMLGVAGILFPAVRLLWLESLLIAGCIREVELSKQDHITNLFKYVLSDVGHGKDFWHAYLRQHVRHPTSSTRLTPLRCIR